MKNITNFSIKAFISMKNLLNISFNHILREANFTNDVVAKIGHSLQDGRVWDTELPYDRGTSWVPIPTTLLASF